MIYLDTSVALAALFDEPRKPATEFWTQAMVSSRLLQYELLVRFNALGTAPEPIGKARVFLEGVMLIDLDQPTLARALQPFPFVIRTLDAIHLATMDFLRGQGLDLEVATYDRRLAETAKAMGFELANV